MTFFLTNLGRYEILLGKPWLYFHDPEISWRNDSLVFKSSYCKNNCLTENRTTTYVPSVYKTTHTLPSKMATPTPDRGPPRRTSAAVFQKLAEQNGAEIFTLSLYDIEKRLSDLGEGESIAQISSRDIRYRIRYNENNTGSSRATKMTIAGFSAEDIAIALKPKIYADPKKLLPKHFHSHLSVFDAQSANLLPPHRTCDHKIELKNGTTAPSGPLYNMSVQELTVLRKFLQENLDKGFIRASSSPAASPVLFAKKPGGGLRFCVDYRALNAITIKNRYPLPLIQETLSRLSKAKFYTKLDVIAAFNQIRIAEGDEWLTAFNTRYGLFESLVMPFGLTNAPATFQARINEILRPFLDIFCTAYIDDVLIYSDNLVDHRRHVNSVLKAIKESGLKLDIKKCAFEVKEVTYLGMIISTTGVRMDP
ncbi:hypothetical protein K3495_g12971, partial [Podosphaera aphanis]